MTSVLAAFVLALAAHGCSLVLEPAVYVTRDVPLATVDGALDGAPTDAPGLDAFDGAIDAADGAPDVPVDACVSTGPEVCDGIDNDCNGMIDEGLGTLSCGTGACMQQVAICDNGRHIPCVPGIPQGEICDGLDNDCNGLVDDGLGVERCGVGACSTRVEHCVMGRVQTCVPLPAGTEVCNGLDDDCDGTPDNHGACESDAGVACMAPGTLCAGPCVNLLTDPRHCGACDTPCAAGQTCVDGRCAAACVPIAEVCDGVDNDCNTLIDENLGSTSCGAGICARTVLNCVGAHPQGCMPGPAMPESCNGLDDDCNGTVDDNLTDAGMACATGRAGECAMGVRTCISGVPRCMPLSTPSGEVCNGLDDDCNGAVDDNPAGLGMPCISGQPGPCAAGLTVCRAGVSGCRPVVAPAAEICNGLDDNCNGTVDDGVFCGVDAGIMCASPTVLCAGACVNLQTDAANCGACGGACASGQVCAAGRCAAPCVPGIEVCNGLDDNCDGIVDNVVNAGTTCSTGQPGRCAAGHVACPDVGAMARCVPNNGPVAEVCNGVDDNCDGMVDNVAGVGTRCATGLLGVCGIGSLVCGTSALLCSQLTSALPDVCNGLDDNCDGMVDNCAVAHTCVTFAALTVRCCRRAPDMTGCTGCTAAESCFPAPGSPGGNVCCLH